MGAFKEAHGGTLVDLYLGEPVTVRARASGAFQPDAGVTVSGNSVTGSWSAELPLQSPVTSKGVAALWGRARIADLMDSERRGSNPEETRAAVVETAIEHHLVSKYTSLVAVDKTPARPAGDPLSSKQVPNLLPYDQSMNAIFGFPATATAAPLLRLTGVICLISALLLLMLLQFRDRHVPVSYTHLTLPTIPLV